MSGGSESEEPKAKRQMPKFLQEVMKIKAVIKADDSDIKDGPALTTVVSSYLKSAGSVEKAIEHYHKLKKSGEFKKSYNDAAKRIADKRQKKKEDKAAAKSQSRSRKHSVSTDSD